MLGTIREYALERLAERHDHEQVRARHAAFFLALAERAVEGLTGDGSTGAPAPAARPWRVVSRLGEQTMRSLVADSRAGMTNHSLAERYSISLSSVKRILRRIHV